MCGHVCIYRKCWEHYKNTWINHRVLVLQETSKSSSTASIFREAKWDPRVGPRWNLLVTEPGHDLDNIQHNLTFNYPNWMPFFLNLHVPWRDDYPLLPIIHVLNFLLWLKWASPYVFLEAISTGQQFSEWDLGTPEVFIEPFHRARWSKQYLSLSHSLINVP